MTETPDSTDETSAFPALDGLSDRHRVFVLAYCGDARFNATKSAKTAGYSGDSNALNVSGCRILQRQDVKAAVRELLEASCSTPEEVISRTARRARSSAVNMLTVKRHKTTGAVTSAELSLVALVESGEIDNVKSIRKGKFGYSVELYDAQAADNKLLEVYKKTLEDGSKSEGHGATDIIFPGELQVIEQKRPEGESVE